jgi:hypothetical protein
MEEDFYRQENRRKPPKLRSIDRALSVTVESYKPIPSMLSKRHEPLVINMDEPNLHRRKSSPTIHKERYLDSHYEPNMENIQSKSYAKVKRSHLRRGETIDFPSTFSYSTDASKRFDEFNLDEQVSMSLNSNPCQNQLIQSSASNSQLKSNYRVNNHPQFDDDLQDVNQTQLRRNNKTYFSFHDTKKQKRSTRTCDISKSNSMSSEDHILSNTFQPSTSKHSSSDIKRNWRQIAIENDMYRPYISNRSRQVFELPTIQRNNQWISTSPTFFDARRYSVNLQNNRSPRSAAKQSQILSRQSTLSSKHQLAPQNQQRFRNQNFESRKSQSVRYKERSDNASKENRELFKSRKSKSFIFDDNEQLNYPYSISDPHITLELPQQNFEEELKRLSGEEGSNLFVTDVELELPSIEFGALGFNAIYQSYREKQKNSESRENKRKRSTFSVNDGEISSKRKKIVCFVIIIFSSIIVLTVLAVYATLTHSSETQIQNQTRHTFSRDSRPIHFSGGIN